MPKPPIWRPRPIPRIGDARCIADFDGLDRELRARAQSSSPAVVELAITAGLRYESGGPCLRGPGRAVPWSELDAHGLFEPSAALKESPGQGRALASEIGVHVSRMRAAIELGVAAPRVDAALVSAMHGRLLPGQPGGGRLREGAMVLAQQFTAPRPQSLGPGLAELAAFVDGGEGPDLLRAALAHAQLVNLHPFCDANGRLARALVRVVLERAQPGASMLGVWTVMAFTPSAFSAANAAYRAGRPMPWLALFIRAARSALVLGARSWSELDEAASSTARRIQALERLSAALAGLASAGRGSSRRPQM